MTVVRDAGLDLDALWHYESPTRYCGTSLLPAFPSIPPNNFNCKSIAPSSTHLVRLRYSKVFFFFLSGARLF
jgi:hypothetical protein